jgi:hypothetical protein
MTQRDRHTIYKGLRVTVRWTEREPRLYTSSYLIGDQRADHTEWHHFTDLVFHTHDTAAVFGLAQAKRAIDAMASP